MYLGPLVCSILLIVFYVNSFASSLNSERDDCVAVSGHLTLSTATTLREEILEKSFKDCLFKIKVLVGSHPIQHCFLSYVNEDPDMLWMRRIESYLREVGVQSTYDMRTLGVGDSINAFIQTGVEKSDFAVILFSPRYFANFERGTYIRTEADEIQRKWRDVEGFVIPLLLAEHPRSSIPSLMDRRPKDLSTEVLVGSIEESSTQQSNGLDTLYIPLTKGSDCADFEESLECIFRMLKERIYKSVVGADAPFERDFNFIKRKFDDRKLRIPGLEDHTELKATRGSFPQSLKTYNAFFDRTNEIGQSYVDAIFEELFMGHMDERQFATLTICALSGMGGVGKTTLATEFTHKYRQFYQFVCWMDGSSKREFISSCVDLLESFGVLVPKQRETEEEVYFSTIICMVNEFLPKHKKNWLLVVDNIEESEFVTELAPAGGHVLYTSRNRDWLKRLEIDVFKPDESVAYLLQMTGFDESHKSEAMALAVELDHLPLALAQVAAYVMRQQRPGQRYTFNDYLVQYKERYAYLLAQNQIQPSLNKRTAIVMTTWDTTMQKLSQEAQQLASYFSYMAPTAIPTRVFSNSIHQQHAISELINYSMVKCDERNFLSIHRLVQCVAREKYERLSIVENILNEIIEMWALWFAQEYKKITTFAEEESSTFIRLINNGQQHVDAVRDHIETLARKKSLGINCAISLWIYSKMLDYQFIDNSLQRSTTTNSTFETPSIAEEILNAIEVKKRREILECINLIFGANFPDANDMPSVINILNQYSNNDLKVFCDHVFLCVTPDMNATYRKRIMLYLNEIIDERRTEFIEGSRFIYGDPMDTETLCTYLWGFAESEGYFKPDGAFGEIISLLGEDEIGEEEVSMVDDEERTPNYYPYLEQLINLGIPEEFYDDAMNFIPNITVEQSIEFSRVIKDVFCIDENGRYHVTRFLLSMKNEEAQTFVRKVTDLLVPEMDSAHRYIFIMKFAELEKPDTILYAVDKVRELRSVDDKKPIIHELISGFENNYLAILVYQSLVELIGSTSI